MTKQATNTAEATNVSSFTLANWRKKLTTAAKSELSAASKVYWAVIEARGAFDTTSKAGERSVRETAKAAFERAGMDKRSVQKRVSDTMAILKAPAIPGDAPENLQRCADAVRAARPDAQKRKPRQPSGDDKGAGSADDTADQPIGKADAVKALRGTIDGLAKRAADDETADMLASLRSILDES